jgi:exodeoxyribonuclease V gamma subunit
MENLLLLFNKIHEVSPLPIFSQDVVVVQNAGMQHWLNMSVAQTRGISMNSSYALPAQFLWKLIRAVASDEDVPEQSPYSREVLCWRLFKLLGNDELLIDSDFADVFRYLSSENNKNSENKLNSSSINQVKNAETSSNAMGEQGDQTQLKRYQLAVQLADLFEQYLVFRPDWLDQWQQGQFIIAGETDVDVINHTKWQAKLWFALQTESPYNPQTLLTLAAKNLPKHQSELPKRISFFGINAMAPMWLSFIEKLSQYTQVHFYHLNPCADYWGDIQTQKQLFRHMNSWLDGFDDMSTSVGNPLLANLGQQGREFLALLQESSTYQLDVFDDIEPVDSQENLSVLHHVQQDILALRDASNAALVKKDHSITITSAHSALREVQGLHDWLLHQFNNDTTLTPKDVLVMCPQIENYAPYVDAVFARGWQELADDVPPLPCSIADRISKDSEPLVAAFLELLQLPDSRFYVSQLLGFLRNDAVQQKFNFTDDELNKIATWLEKAAIHWGIDQQHKATVLNVTQASKQFTWQQGLSRLMQGFAYGDVDVVFNQQLLLSNVEGSDSELLGRLMLVIEQLQQYAMQLTSPKSVEQWQRYLYQLLEQCFAQIEDNSFDIITTAIDLLVEYSHQAHFDDDLPLSVVQEFLSHHFSQPDPGRQFMIGQVTFCSMLPMRSIPFKVIAVLGLNDGDYPRQRKPQAFDLMQYTATRIGDRSRRGDDRYLFLEAIISARQALYLSYQGRNIKNNAHKQPSLVLKELMEYLSAGYGWQCDAEKPLCDIRQLAMQAFSDKNYQGDFASFDAKWLNFSSSTVSNNHSPLVLPQSSVGISLSNNQVNNEVNNEAKSGIKSDVLLSLDTLLRFYQHPAKAFAQTQLDLHLDNRDVNLEDVEPFDVNQLTSYLYREQSLAIEVNPSNNNLSHNNLSHNNAHIDIAENIHDKNTQQAQLKEKLLLSGQLPDVPTTLPILDKWQQDSETFGEEISTFSLGKLTRFEVVILLAVEPANIDEHNLHSEHKQHSQDNPQIVQLSLPIQCSDEHVIFYRSSTAKGKDLLNLAIVQACLQLHQSGSNTFVSRDDEALEHLKQLKQTLGFYFDTKAQKVVKYHMSAFEQPLEFLQQVLNGYYAGQQQPLLLNAVLAEKVMKAKVFEQSDFEKFWQDPNNSFPLGHDPYMQYFWPQAPIIEQHIELINAIYQPVFSGAKKLK